MVFLFTSILNTDFSYPDIKEMSAGPGKKRQGSRILDMRLPPHMPTFCQPGSHLQAMQKVLPVALISYHV